MGWKTCYEVGDVGDMAEVGGTGYAYTLPPSPSPWFRGGLEDFDVGIGLFQIFSDILYFEHQQSE